MKTTVEECQGQFFVNFVAETAEEASLLARMAMNHTKRGFQMHATASEKSFSGYISMRKHMDVRSYIKRK